MGLSEKLIKTNEEPRNELQMLMELLNSGSKDEQRMLAQALLEMGQQADQTSVTCSQRRPIYGSLLTHFRIEIYIDMELLLFFFFESFFIKFIILKPVIQPLNFILLINLPLTSLSSR